MFEKNKTEKLLISLLENSHTNYLHQVKYNTNLSGLGVDAFPGFEKLILTCTACALGWILSANPCNE